MIQTSYVQLIADELRQRKQNNSLYSLRAFAQHLGLTPAYLSLILNKKRHPSDRTAREIGRKLNWNQSKLKYFVNLLDYENPRGEEMKERAYRNLQKIEKSVVEFNSLDLDIFSAIADWHHNAILCLLTLKNNIPTIPYIAKRLSLSIGDVETSLLRLKRLGLVDRDKKHWTAKQAFLRVKSKPSQAIRGYHKQILQLASRALDEQSIDERDFTNLTLSVDKNQLKKAKKKIMKFQSEMTRLLEGQNATEVYQLSIQLFSLTKEGSKK